MGDSSAGSWKRSRVVISRANLDDLSNAERAALIQFSRLLRTVQQVKDAGTRACSHRTAWITLEDLTALARSDPAPLAAVVDRLPNAFEDERPAE